MRDPHVVWLQYRLEPGGGVVCENPPPIEHESSIFTMRLAEGVAKFEMKEHYASEDEARKAVDEFLRAWQISAALRSGATEMRFSFENACVIDRNPPPPGSAVLVAATGKFTVTGHVHAALTAVRRAYPAPPTSFKVSPDVETLWERYQGYRNGREPLPSMAHFCLTVPEAKATGREKAARKYAIAKNVIDRLGKLTREGRGDAKTARKMSASLVPHTPGEVAWIETAIRVIIRRVGEANAGATGLQQIKLNALPPI